MESLRRYSSLAWLGISRAFTEGRSHNVSADTSVTTQSNEPILTGREQLKPANRTVLLWSERNQFRSVPRSADIRFPHHFLPY